MTTRILFALFIIAGCSSSSQNQNVSGHDGGGYCTDELKDGGITVRICYSTPPTPDAAVIADATPLSPDLTLATHPDSGPDTTANSPETTIAVVPDGSPDPSVDTKSVTGPDAAPDVILSLSDAAVDTKVLVVQPDVGPDLMTPVSDLRPNTPDLPPDLRTIAPDTGPDLAPPAPDTAPIKSDARTGPACNEKAGYSLCGSGNNGCCSSNYHNMPDPGSSGALFDGMFIKPESATQVYGIHQDSLRNNFLVPFSAAAVLEWTSQCTETCLGSTPPSANGCSIVWQVADADLASYPSPFTYATKSMPFRPGTVVIVYNGNKYVITGQTSAKQLHKLNPPTLEDLIFPGSAAGREQVVDAAYVAGYTMGTDITDASQYVAAAACQGTFISMELDYLIQ